MGSYMEYPPTYCDGALYVNTFAGRTVALDADDRQGALVARGQRREGVVAGDRRARG